MQTGVFPDPDTGQRVSHQTSILRFRHVWPALVLVLLVALVYWPGRNGGYIFDDFPNIVDNTALHVSSLDWRAWLAAVFSSDAGSLHRPLAMLTFAINHYFTGLDPVPMKLTGIAIHALNACLVLVLVRTLLAVALAHMDARRREWVARFAAAAWALHPINLIAVLFVVQRMETLSHTFVFAGLLLYLLGRQRQLDGKGGWTLILGGVIGGTVLGVLSKESAVLLPLYAALLEWCLPRLRGKAAPQALPGMFAAILVVPACLGAAWLLPRFLTAQAYANRAFTLGERLLTEGRVVLDYLYWTVFPSLRNLSLYHDDYRISHGLLDPPSTALALAALLLAIVAALFLRKRRPLVALGIFWFLAAQLLTATFIPLELVFEHRNYFASLGICLALADLLLVAPTRGSPRRIGVLLAVLWLLALGMTTALRAQEWSNQYRFAASEAAKHPQSPRATYSHARLLVMATDYKPDSPILDTAIQALEHARAVPHSGILPHSIMLVLAARTGKPSPEEWWDDMLQRLRDNPIGPQETNALATLESCVREGHCRFAPERMLAAYQAALSHGPQAEVLNMYAEYVLNEMGQPEAALYLWRRAIALAPDEAQYRINLIKVLIALDQEQEAGKQIELLRQRGWMSQNEAAAATLKQRLLSSQHSQSHPPEDRQ